MNDSRHVPIKYAGPLGALTAVLGLLFLTAAIAAAQSTDISFPTPASTNEISGTIIARDIGDARLTRHFYILSGTPGDLLFTVTSNNLNGDVDLFTAGSLRPLGKISMYAGSGPSTATKTVFLRQRETLILRVEARSANDNAGTYRVSFAGTFEPVMAAAATPAEESGATPNASERRERGVRRVTSSGARIDEPEPEISARTETTTETTPAPAPTTTEAATENTAPVEPAPRPEPARTARTSRPRGRRRIRVTPQPTRPQPAEPSTETTNPSATEPALNPRLIIETRDGMRTERFMSTVRSVTVQNGQVVIVSSRGGRVERISLASILKMSIEP